MVEGHCLQAMKIVHHHANGCFDWLISGQQSVNPSREAISILSGKYKRFTFVHPVLAEADLLKLTSLADYSLLSNNLLFENHHYRFRIGRSFAVENVQGFNAPFIRNQTACFRKRFLF